MLPAAIALSIVGFGARAHAADIATVVGPVGTAQWRSSCPGPQNTPGGATSQLTSCPGGGADCLHGVVIDATEFPEATCSDGTPGVFYVRPGSLGDEDRWVIHLQGGGTCRDFESCLERWCGEQGGLPYTANKMSSDWDQDGVTDLRAQATGPGMASADPANTFATWTHVWAYYCSSDAWQGTASDVTFDDGAGNSFDLDTRGHTILYAMRKMLRKLNADPAWTAAGGYSVGDLDDATEIVFTGTSAGGAGAVANADWFLSAFPNSDNSLVVDAAFDIDDWVTVMEDLRSDEVPLDGAGDGFWADTMINAILESWDTGGFQDLMDAFHDETCRGVYEPLGRMDRCDIAPVLFSLNTGGIPMIETPTFVRVDLEDNVLSDFYTQSPNDLDVSVLIGPGFGAPRTTIDDFARMMRASVLMAYDDHDSVTGVFAPRCGDHVGLEAGNTFGVQTVPDTDDAVPRVEIPLTAITFEDALWEWLNVGGGGTRVDIRRLDTDETGNSFSGC
jgi:Pectinacetylesterase